jgi:molybdate transport system substrate-binding protein
MVNRSPKLGFLTLVLYSGLVLAAARAFAETKPKQELLVGAAASLKDVLEEIAPQFEQQNPTTKLIFQFASSGSLQQQIEQGAPFDVFVSAAEQQVAALLQKDLLVKDSVRRVFGNSLVLVVPKGKNSLQTIDDLKKPEYKKIAIGEKQTVPAGQYAEQWLENSKVLSTVKGRLVPAANVRQVLTFVETGNVDAGFVYKTDAMTSTRVELALEAERGLLEPIVYPLALVKKSKNQDLGRTFAVYLQSESVRKIWQKRGFLSLPEKAL